MSITRPTSAPIRRGSVAAYRQIARELRSRIAGGDFAAESRLPTEDELMEQFGVSRHTVRSALAVLVADGLVERYAGRGTFVVDQTAQNSEWKIRSLDDIVNENFPADPEILEVVWVAADSDREAAKELHLESFEKMLRITAARRGADGPLACSEIFVPVDVGRRIEPDLKKYLSRQPIVRLIETRLGLRASHAIQVATMRLPPPQIATTLSEPDDRMTIVLMRTYTTLDGQAFEFSRLFGKPGIFSNVIEFARQDAG